MRLKLVKWHKWLGLCCAIFLLFQAISGSVLSLRDIVEESVPVAPPSTGDVRTLPDVDRVLTRLQEEWGDYAVSHLRFPSEDTPYILARLYKKEDASVQFAAIDGAGLGPIQGLDMPHGLMFTLFQLHENLKFGSSGRVLNILMGIVLLFMSVTGVYFWWPLRARQKLKISWKAPLRKRWYDLHRVTGVLAVPVFLVLVITGAGISIRLLSIQPPSLIVSEQSSDPENTLNPALARISKDHQIHELRFNYQKMKASVLINTAAPAWPGGRDKITVDLQTGIEIAHTKTTDLPLGQQFLGWFYPVHTKLALGLSGQIIVFLAGLFLAIGVVSGLRLWWIRKSVNKKA